MGVFGTVWRKLTPTKALQETSGKLEIAFFENVYRLVYITGVSSSDRDLFYRVYGSIAKLIIILFISSEMWCFISDSSSLDEGIDNISVVLIHLISCYRYLTMVNNRDLFKKLSASMESPYFDTSTDKRRKILKFWIKRNDKYLKLVLSLGHSCLAAWYIYPLLDDLEYNLPLPVYMPFDYRTPILYPIAYVIVFISFNYTSYLVMLSDVIMQAHLMHLLCQYIILGDCFENIIRDCNVNFKDIHNDDLYKSKKFQKKYLEKLGNLVEQHQFVLNHTHNLKKVLSVPLLGQLAASLMLICLAGYQVTGTVTANILKFCLSLFYLSYNMFELYIYCQWCDEIKMQSENIRQSIYFSYWENGMATVPGVRSRLMLVVARATKPEIITAGGLYELSMNSYTNILKTSYSALTVLLRVRND